MAVLLDGPDGVVMALLRDWAGGEKAARGRSGGDCLPSLRESVCGTREGAAHMVWSVGRQA